MYLKSHPDSPPGFYRSKNIAGYVSRIIPGIPNPLVPSIHCDGHAFSSFVIWKHIVVEILVVLVCGHVLSYDSSRLSLSAISKGNNK